jgi:hypothetical protein
MVSRKQNMNSNILKLIAIITMLVDHVGYVLFPQLTILRIIGRIAFPIFTFLIAEGYHHTKSVNKYMVRLGSFALISEIPFDLAFHGKYFEPHSQNIFFTLLLGLVAIRLYNHFKNKNSLIAVLSVVLTCVISFVFKTDYYVFGVVIIFAFHQLRDYSKLKLVVVSLLLVLLTIVIALSMGDYTLNSTYQIFSLFSLVLIYLYNGKPGMKLNKLKFALYAFYPVHITAIYLVSLIKV